MGPIERVQRVLAGQQPDRPPLSFWHHFSADKTHGPAAAKAHIDHLEVFDLDFLKVMNDNGYAHAAPIARIDDLASLSVLRGDELEFSRQLDLLADLKRTLHGRVLMTTTIFNAWRTLRILMPTGDAPSTLDSADGRSHQIRQWFAQNPDAVRTALATIGTSLANFARRCIAAGANGIFFSARDAWVDSPDDPQPLYDELVRPTDLEILAAASTGSFNLLHVCGRAVDFRRSAEYPVHAINWADRTAGPAIADAGAWLGPTICAGLDHEHTMPNGAAEDCEAEVLDALLQAGGRPIMICPGCTYVAEDVPHRNLEAICHAVRR